MSYQQVIDGQVNPEIPVNENMQALGQCFTFSHDVTADSALVVGITRGRFNGATLADATVACTNNATNYVVANRSTGAVSSSTASTNWNDTTTYGRVGMAVFASGVLTYHDERLSEGGIFDYGAAVVSAIADVLIFKGVIDCSANPNYPAADAGHLYKVSVAGKIGGASGPNVEAGDTLYCTADSTASGTHAAVGASWNIAQVNVDGAVVGPASATNNRVALFDGVTGKLIKDSGLTLAGTNTGDETVTTAGALINGATAKATPVDADYIGLMDSAASNVLKKLSWLNVKATLKTYFDTLYATVAQPYDIGGGCTGAPAASLVLLRYPMPRAVSFVASLTGSQGIAATAATAQTDFDLKKNGVSFGTMRFAAAGTVASFIAASPTSFAAGDVLTVVAPASPDATLAYVGFALVGAR